MNTCTRCHASMPETPWNPAAAYCCGPAAGAPEPAPPRPTQWETWALIEEGQCAGGGYQDPNLPRTITAQNADHAWWTAAIAIATNAHAWTGARHTKGQRTGTITFTDRFNGRDFHRHVRVCVLEI